MSTAAPSGDSASAVTLAGARSAGGVVSLTSTDWAAVAALPAASAAVHVTTVVPIGSTGGASLSSSTGPAASEAAGGASSPPGAAESYPAAESASSSRARGGSIRGGVVSLTSTDCLAVAALPAASAAVHVTTVVPIGNTGGASLSSEATPTASVALAAPMSTAAPSGDSASAVTSGGARSDGGAVSRTVISCAAVAVFPAASVAVQVSTVAPSGRTGGASLSSVTGPARSDDAGSSNRLPAPTG